MSSKIKKAATAQDRIKELEAENTRLRNKVKELEEIIEEDYQQQLEFNRMYKGD